MKLTIQAPASSANLGCGYDTLGAALNLCNSFEMKPGGPGVSLHAKGVNGGEMAAICQRMTEIAASLFCERSGAAPVPFTLHMTNRVPIARGLGSSATLRLAVMAGLNRLTGAEVDGARIVQWCTELEGCSDNVAAAWYGGLVASGIVHGELRHYKVELPESLDFVAVSPSLEVSTDKARVIFPPELPREEAVHNLSRGIMLAMAFSQGDFERIGDLMDDRLHQPARQANIPALKPLYDVIHAAREAGAAGAYLSGSGSTMMAITLRNKESVADAMREAITRYGMESETRFLKADNQGLRIKVFE
ncbi:MAG: homoserine kinase [bacterium]|nr:homoserine kinase [bacterium]